MKLVTDELYQHFTDSQLAEIQRLARYTHTDSDDFHHVRDVFNTLRAERPFRLMIGGVPSEYEGRTDPWNVDILAEHEFMWVLRWLYEAGKIEGKRQERKKKSTAN